MAFWGCANGVFPAVIGGEHHARLGVAVSRMHVARIPAVRPFALALGLEKAKRLARRKPDPERVGARDPLARKAHDASRSRSRWLWRESRSRP